MKKIFSFILTLLITFLPVFNINNLSFADSKPNLTAEYAVLMDYETGQVLYSKNGYNKLYPASTTKAWTAYVVLKHVSDLNQVVEIKDLPIVDGSSMYLKEGESFTVKELLDALLIHSSNDVAMVLAKYVGGSVENFVNMMNNEAKAIGAKNTHFNNPHGLPDENHYTTAYDMALMARKAMDNDIFDENDNQEKEKIKIENINKKTITVFISGEVKNPGVVTIDAEKRLSDAVNELGGTTENADLNKVNLAMKLKDESHYIIPKIGDNLESYNSETFENDIENDLNNKNNLININTASIQELDTLPGIGEATANKIVNYREEKGKFNSIEEIKNVNGIGDKKYEELKTLISIE